MRRLLSVILPILMLVAGSCRQEEDFVLAAEFEPYVQRFVKEGQKRGVAQAAEARRIRIEFGQLPPNARGACGSKSRTITINPDLWNTTDNREKERLLFHELGHCVLGRGHRNETFPNGECKSLMRGQEEGYVCTLYYSGQKMAYYLDELFDSRTPEPRWATMPSEPLPYYLRGSVVASPAKIRVGVSVALESENGGLVFYASSDRTDPVPLRTDTNNLYASLPDDLPAGTYRVRFAGTPFQPRDVTVAYNGGHLDVGEMPLSYKEDCYNRLTAGFSLSRPEISLQGRLDTRLTTRINNTCGSNLTGVGIQKFYIQGGRAHPGGGYPFVTAAGSGVVTGGTTEEYAESNIIPNRLNELQPGPARLVIYCYDDRVGVFGYQELDVTLVE